MGEHSVRGELCVYEVGSAGERRRAEVGIAGERRRVEVGKAGERRRVEVGKAGERRRAEVGIAGASLAVADWPIGGPRGGSIAKYVAVAHACR
jgi:hypothetical protein